MSNTTEREIIDVNPRDFDEKSCGVVLFREKDGKRLFLLLHYPGGHWDFPKGHVEEGEDSEHETTCRELEEETGIRDIIFFEGFRHEVFYKPDKEKEIVKLVVFFLGKTTESKVEISHEHQGYEWLEYDAAYNRATFGNAKDLLNKANDFLKTTSV